MLRTQVYLTEDLSQELKFLAQRESKTTASIIRELLRKGLKTREKKKNAGGILLDIANLKMAGPKDTSNNFYKYSYGKKSSYAAKK